MFLNYCRLMAALSLLLGSIHVLALDAGALAVSSGEEQAYCNYVLEQAQAQRDLLRTPMALAGMTQPENGLPMQLVGGASVGLSGVRKAGLTMDVARKNCELYKATTGAQLDIQYAIPSLEKEALRNRLVLIEQALGSVDALIEKTSKMLEAQNATRLMVFTLQTTKIKLEADRADTRTKITALYTPPLSEKPLKELVARKQKSEEDEQKAVDKLSRQNSWDVALSVGVHQQVNPVAQGAQPYGAVSVNYNFASRAIDKHLDRAVVDYGEWKKMQEGDVVRNMEVLRQQLSETMTVQQAKLKSLQEESEQIQKSLQLLAEPDTSAGLDFHNQLTASRLVLEVETGDSSFRIDGLRAYLAKNFE
jgi:hypothetical protein